MNTDDRVKMEALKRDRRDYLELAAAAAEQIAEIVERNKPTVTEAAMRGPGEVIELSGEAHR